MNSYYVGIVVLCFIFGTTIIESDDKLFKRNLKIYEKILVYMVILLIFIIDNYIISLIF